jgi:hypothetical protein
MPWNTATINNVRVPGIVEVTGTLSRKDDTADVPGQDGVTMTVLGYAPAQFNMQITMWTAQQAAEYQALMLRFMPTQADKNLRDAAARAVTVIHPAIRMTGRSQLTIYEMTTPDHQGRQIHRATIQFREFIPEIKRSSTAGVKKVKDPQLPEYKERIEAPMRGPSTATGDVARLRAVHSDPNLRRLVDMLSEEMGGPEE